MVVNVELRAGRECHFCWTQMQECGVGTSSARVIFFPMDFLCPLLASQAQQTGKPPLQCSPMQQQIRSPVGHKIRDLCIFLLTK